MRLDGTKLAWSVLTLFFAGAVAVTLSSEDFRGPRNAQAQEAEPAVTPSPSTSHKDGASHEAGKAEISEGSKVCLSDPSVIEDLKKRREELALRAKELTAKESELNAREAALNDEFKKMEKIRDEIASMRNLLKKENEEKIAKLVEMFETMSPKAASQTIASLDEPLAIAAMARMTTQRLAKIMNLMEPAKASRLSELLAGVVRARIDSASNGAAVTTAMSAKGGEQNNGRNEQRTSDNPSSQLQRDPAQKGQRSQ